MDVAGLSKVNGDTIVLALSFLSFLVSSGPAY